MKKDAFNLLFSIYKKKALKRGLKFSLSLKDFKKLIGRDCHYCGGEPRFSSIGGKGKEILWNGIDRLENSKGYHLVNCVPCCKVCNRFKGSRDYSEFMALVNAIYSHQVDGNDENTRTVHVVERNAGMRGSAILKHIYDFVERDNLQKADIVKLLEALIDEHLEEVDYAE